MTLDDHEALEARLAQMRAIHETLAMLHAGICVLHLEAAIAALESHLRRSEGVVPGDLRPGLVTVGA